ncbi:hypothetical protein BACCIP111895_02062 [Neobacillus rhizosphaerae]|uniref:Peptide O-xylosyltransferase n=1 Tax=Neobacillus rhizosphaerae TaxID=2880965 RepID=A0ABM9ERV9_9BACI|nr:beta-1,6-N-acetylglucosaminyltransferase [Neobacillus rhizosphaerae]CAH2714886.1 hypothetical protein BACCIP111895_02062 [Neobacillus rhizosphaerae]
MNSDLRTAFLLQIHKNPDQVNQFIKQLISEGQADVFVHIDKRNYEKLNEKIIKSPNVKVLQQNIVCEWGDISQIDATILLIREALASKNEYDYVCLRSGQDLLVKEGFKEFLIKNQGKIFMKIRNTDRKKLGFMKINWPRVTRRRYTSTHPIRVYRRLVLSLYNKGINISPNSHQFPLDYTFYTGSQWFTIPVETAKYIIKFLDENEWYYKYFENSLVPDECFFHTLLLNSHFKHEVVNNNLMFFKWGKTLSERNSPQNLTTEDIPLIEGANQFFARKFDENVDKSVIEYFTNQVWFGSKK